METRICTKCNNEFPATTEYFHVSKSSKFGLKSWCKNCANEHENEKRRIKRELIPKTAEGYKICSKCNRELEISEKYFHRSKAFKDGFSSMCKECKGFKFTEIKPKAKEGYKICNSCNRELPATTEYFYSDKTAKSELKTFCKECCYKEHEEKRLEKRRKKSEEAKKAYIEKIGIGMKECSKCGSILPETNKYFNKHKDGVNGLRAHCKECQREEMKTYQNKEEVKLHRKEYKEQNAEHFRRIALKYRKENADKLRQHKRKNNATICQRRQARKRALPATLTLQEWEQIKKDFNNKCAYCGKEKPLQQEHFIALTKNGEYTHNNIIPACQTCNCSKGKKDFFEWYPNYMHYSKKRENFILKHLNYTNNGEQQLTIAL